MLNPDSRSVFLEALRPPDDFELDIAVATTYTLDLTAMLLAPLAFGRLDGFRREVPPGAARVDGIDPFVLLKAIRVFAERTTVFCQSNRISVPRAYNRLHTYLEGSIVQVTPPKGNGVFHPKVWALRFVGPEDQVRYRVLNLSRNLTFDGCWDTSLVLEGQLDQNRIRAIGANNPLGDFFAALPGLAVNKVSPRVAKSVAIVADEVRRLVFELPEEFSEYRFAPIGIEGYSDMPFEDRCDERLVISPFLSSSALAEMPGSGGTLVSRLEELDKLPNESLKLFEKVLVLSDGADQPEGEGDEDSLVSESESNPPPTGLHAKVFVFDTGWDSGVWSGSANATTAAFSQNVEFLIGLWGKKSKVGVGACLSEPDGTPTLMSMLQPYTRSGVAVESQVDLALEAALREARASLARVAWRAEVESLSDSQFRLVLSSKGRFEVPDGCTLETWPITLQRTFAQPLVGAKAGARAVFEPCSLDGLTAFFAVSLTLKVGAASKTEEFVVTAPLSGAPENRIARVLESLLSSPEDVLRFLRLLLAQDAFDIIEALSDEDARAGLPLQAVKRGKRAEPPLLEALLRSLAREPAHLDAIDQMVGDLQKTEQGVSRLPPGFLAAWEPIRQARAMTREVAR